MVISHELLAAFSNQHGHKQSRVTRLEVRNVACSLSQSELICGCLKVFGLPHDSNIDLSSSCEIIETLLVKDMCSSIFDSQEHIETIRSCFYVLSTWMCTNLGRHRIWPLFTLMAMMLSLYELSITWQTHGYIREILRTFTSDLQHT